MRAAAIALLALATVWPRWRSAQALIGVAAGGLLVASVWDASFDGRHVQWAVPIAVVAAVTLWWSAPLAQQRLAAVPGGAWWVLLGSAAAVYGCVPETDHLREVAVVAKRDPMYDEVPVAFVLHDPDAPGAGDRAALADRIQSVCTERLPGFKRPREVRVVDSLPRSTLEKVAKAELRRLLEG